MTLHDRLATALADRYAIEREIGRGGMAVVFLARDLKHERRVAVKVLRPEVSVAIGAERFLREIQIAAALQHPHILPLHDSGQAHGLLYYVMPYVEGESLRERLDRERQLPLTDALRIAREVADALSAAHAHGVVHRDIKPDNVLLSGGHAVVADFGIARAISAAGGATLTTSGLAMGTPAYMSPEQAAGDQEVDGRTDIYALGCMVYEMLAGEPPFSGATPQAIMARHAVERPPTLTIVRPTVAPTVQRAIETALAKVPADRFQTAGQFADAIESVPAVPPVARRRWIPLAVGAVGVVAAVAGGWRLMDHMRSRGSTEALDPNLVAVLPFRVAAADTTLAFLGEGMLDLLAARLTDRAGPRAVDPRSLLSVWHREAGEAAERVTDAQASMIARGFGAGRLISGGIVAGPQGLVVRASLLSVPDAAVRASATVEGPRDSLSHMVDRLVGQLLALEAGESPSQLASLTSTSLPALRAYLDGQRAYRGGQYEDAVTAYRRALAIDSTFALAGIGLRNAAGWTAFQQDAMAEGLARAWAFRDRLSYLDRTYLTALAGPHYPAPSSIADQLVAWERVVHESPDRALAWWELGEVLFHWSPLVGLDAGPQRARAAFQRAFELDSTFTPGLEHLYDLASVAGDTVQVRRLGTAYLARGAGGHPEVVRWQMALALNDAAGLRDARAALDSAGPGVLALVVFYSQIGWPWAAGVADADLAAQTLLNRATTADERWISLGVLHDLALNRGRPGAALAATEAQARLRPADRGPLRTTILDALYWNGDTSAARVAVRKLAPSLEGPLRGGPALRAARAADVCVAEQWRLWRGEVGHSDRRIPMLRRVAELDSPNPAALRAAACADLLDALRSRVLGRPDAAALVARLDSLLRTGPPLDAIGELNLAVARLLEATERPDAALAATRRRPLIPGGERYLATLLREEGRLAALLGDTAAAVRALTHYLTLRSDPEPALRDEIAHVRQMLAALATDR